MGDTEVQRLARRRSVELRRSIGNAIRRMRMDAGLSMAAVSVAAGIHPSYLRLIEAGERDAGDRVLAAIGFVLGADVSVRLFPNTGPRIHDRFQAPMVECLIGALHRRWQPTPEVVVTQPARGVIDLVLGEPRPSTLIASEFNSQLRRLEQQLRWHREKEQSLPSSELWRFAAVDGDPVTSRLLVLRNTSDLRSIASTYAETLRATYPAKASAAVDSLTGTAEWPGAAIIWIHVDGSDVRLLDGPPRGVRLGR